MNIETLKAQLEESIKVTQMVRDQARVHDRQPCCGLPFCVSCRSVVLMNHCYNVAEADKWIATQKEGTVVRLEPEAK